MTLELHSAKCVVRTYRPGDAPSLARNGDNRKIWLKLRDRFPHPYTVDAAEWYIDHCVATDARSYAIQVDGEAIGGISIHPREDVERLGGEIGYWIGEPYWGRGITTSAVRLLTDWALSETELIRVFALPFATNAASCRVLEHAGYVREGTLRSSAIKDGTILDQHVYARVR
jgi:RimJ/RimL family protein N-acetyltransferase